MIQKNFLEKLYIQEKKSVFQIAKELQCSQSKINYWIKSYGISKRSISDSVYLKHNPKGDPFMIQKPKTKEDYFLYGLGIGLYWGEGTKRNKTSVRLGNSDPEMIKTFLLFRDRFFNIERKKLRFEVQLFGDHNPSFELQFWSKFLKVSTKQFYKTVVHPKRGEGSYSQLVKHGVLTVYFNNTKLQKHICELIEKKGYV